MSLWKIAAVQLDCFLGQTAVNLERILHQLRAARAAGARLVVFPECALTGYAFSSLGEARPHAEPIPGPSSELLFRACRELDVWAVVGLLEQAADSDAVYNACVLVGPRGVEAVYRKIHLPHLGVDRFTTPGDRPFAVHQVEDLRLGMAICYDDSFPETARSLMLLGADLIVLPTNWPPGGVRAAEVLLPARALENNVFYAAANRVGEERGFHFIGRSRIADPLGRYLAVSEDDAATILYAEIDPEAARRKHIVHIPGQYELHRTRDRRPEMYRTLAEPKRD